MGETKEFQYTLLGQIDKIIKPDGNPIDYIYDELNRLDTILYPDETTVEYQYDDLNRKTAMADKNGVTDYDYDALGRLTRTVDPANEEVEFEYDEKGRKSKVIYPDDKYVTYDYDEHDRLVTITDRENRVTTYTYDEAGRKKTVKLPNGITTTYIYDVANRVKEIISTKDDGSVVEKIAYDYDGEGNKTIEEIWKEDKYYKRVYSYYKNNTVKGMVETGDNTAEYTYHYDGAGNIDQKTVTKDGITKTYTYSYNDANRMVTESENGEVRRSYAYDLNGNRTQRIISDDGRPVADYYYYDYTDQLEELVEHSGKVYTYGYDGEGNRLWRTYSQYPVVKPPIDDGERVEDPAEFPGWNKDNDSELDHDKGKGNDFKVEDGEKKGSNLTSYIEGLMNIKLASSDPSYLKNLMFVKKDGSDKENEQGNSGGGNDQNNENGNSGSSEVNNGKDKEPGNGNNNNADKENGKVSDNGKNNSNGNGNSNDKEQGNGKDKDNGNSDKSKGKDKEKDNNGQDKNEKENGNGWAKGKDKDKAKGDRGKHLGWYKNGKAGNDDDSHNPGGDKLVNPEIFQVTNYINDLSAENEEVLMTSDVDGNYRGVYTYDNNHDLIGVEDLGEIEGKPNDPLYYLKDALGSVTSITNMNGGIIDSNRFAPYGEPLDPVAKNARLTNSPYGFTGECHDIEGGLVYLRARYYEPETMRFLQQDTLLGDVKEPLTRNLYIYGNDNPLKFVDPSGHDGEYNGETSKDSRVEEAQGYLQKLWFNLGPDGVDGRWGPNTSRAVGKFQTYDGLNSTGELDERTFIELMTMANSTPFVKNYYKIYVGEFSGFVQYTQKNLNTLADSGKMSTYAGDPDGVWAWHNSQTADSVRNYQETKGYTVTGAIDTNTYSNLITDCKLITDPQPEAPIILSTDWTDYSGGFADFRVTQGMGNSGTGNAGVTIKSRILDPITQAAINEAKGLLNNILDEYHPYEWPSAYSIGDYTWSAEYMIRYKNASERAEDVALFFNRLDLADDINKTFGEFAEAGPGVNPYVLAVSSVLVGAWRNQADKEPGIAELPNALGISGWLTKNIAEAKEKSDFIDNSNYKYLVYSGQFLWEKGPRGMFIDNISKLEGTITNRTETRYTDAKDNAKYKQEVLNYLGVIKNFNVNYNQYVSDMNNILDTIDEKYK